MSGAIFCHINPTTGAEMEVDAWDRTIAVTVHTPDGSARVSMPKDQMDALCKAWQEYRSGTLDILPQIA